MFFDILRITISPFREPKNQYAVTQNTLRFMGRWTIATGGFAIISGIFSRLLKESPLTASWALKGSLFCLMSGATSAAILTYFHSTIKDVFSEDAEYKKLQGETITLEYKIAALSTIAYIGAIFACSYFKSSQEVASIHSRYLQPLLSIGLSSLLGAIYHNWQFVQAKKYPSAE